MTDLKCDVKNCAYNKQQLCSKGDIMVGGKTATSPKETRCESFRDKDNDHFVSSFDHPSSSISIDCEATNCKHNSDYRCVSDEVTIRGCTACSCKETLCSTFADKQA